MPINRRSRARRSRRLTAGAQAARCTVSLLTAPLAFAQTSGTQQEPLQLDHIIVEGARPTDAGPLPGLTIRREQIPANVQSKSGKEIRESRSISIGDFMNSRLPSVSVNDYSGNPFQMDINYRGFTASPQIGTPQGFSVFFDGVRVNEPFGDIVNWDLLPLNAIERFDVFPGSNPVFGLNTLGGALSLRTKSGFTAPGIDAQVLTGSWKRKHVQISGGGNNGVLGGFGALTWFDEDGWRDNSPSRVPQFFGRGDWRGRLGVVTATVLLAENDLIGNGVIPFELYQQRPETVFTSPDQTENKLGHFTLGGALDVSETLNITTQAYRRNSDRRGLNGDVYEGFEDLIDEDAPADPTMPMPFDARGGPNPQTLPVCQYVDANGDFARDNPDQPINGPRGVSCDDITYPTTPSFGRNGRIRLFGDAVAGTPGTILGTPIGLLTRTRLDQVTDGGGVQFNWNLDEHKFMVGAAIDKAEADFQMTQGLGSIDASHRVFEDSANISPEFGAAHTDITVNAFDGKQTTSSVYFSETWSPRTNLHVTLASRYNHTKVKTNLGSRTNLRELNEVGGQLPYILCPSSDPASCSKEATVLINPAAQTLIPTSDEFTYKSLNPSLGMSWLPTRTFNVFGNVSRGARVPSVVELGCAFDSTPVPILASMPDFGFTARSLVGPTCNLPTTLSGDPFLPQIRSASGEFGARGRFGAKWEWNTALYRTELKDDIYFVGVGDGRSFFDTVGKTRRQGFEFGLGGSVGPLDISTHYSYVDATFQSRFYIVSPHNSSADFDQNSRSSAANPVLLGDVTLLPSPTAGENRGFGTYRMTRVDPGARLPGIPAHSFNATVTWRATAKWNIGLTMIAHSKSYLRGNENNLHQPAGTDQETGQFFCRTSGGPNCAIDGFAQLATSPGRPFTLPGTVPGYAIFSLDTKYAFGKGFTLFAQFTDLFDKKYFTAGRLGINPFSPSVIGAIGPSGWNYNSSEWQNTTFVGPGAPRGIFIGFSYEWDPRRSG